MTRDDFRRELARLIGEARMRGASHVDVASGEVHRAVGGYPGTDHRMPICCDVMRDAMLPGDEVLAEPPKGKGASLTIRYYISKL